MQAAAYLEDGHQASVNAVRFSPNGLYLASAGEDRRVCVWQVDERRVIARCAAPAAVSELAWHPQVRPRAWCFPIGVTCWQCRYTPGYGMAGA